MRINGLPVPPLLARLMAEGRWVHPGDHVLRRVIPFLKEPVDFLLSRSQIEFESSGSLADSVVSAKLFHEYRGNDHGPRDLPWRDVDNSLLVACNRIPGADLGIALDFRPDRRDPRVLASDWWTEPQHHLWREASPKFSQFVDALRLE